MGKPGPKL
uniref:Uncharacterized protein n=1 Tax=Arundo donax TaxID=35708 RepID=A0A0A9A8S3_ARUDO